VAHDGQKRTLGLGSVLGLAFGRFEPVLLFLFPGNVVKGPDHDPAGAAFGVLIDNALAVHAGPDLGAVPAQQPAFQADGFLGGELGRGFLAGDLERGLVREQRADRAPEQFLPVVAEDGRAPGIDVLDDAATLRGQADLGIAEQGVALGQGLAERILGPASGVDFADELVVGLGQFGRTGLDPGFEEAVFLLDLGPGGVQATGRLGQPGDHGIEGCSQTADGIAGSHGHAGVQTAGFHRVQGPAQRLHGPQHEPGQQQIEQTGQEGVGGQQGQTEDLPDVVVAVLEVMQGIAQSQKAQQAGRTAHGLDEGGHEPVLGCGDGKVPVDRQGRHGTGEEGIDAIRADLGQQGALGVEQGGFLDGIHPQQAVEDGLDAIEVVSLFEKGDKRHQAMGGHGGQQHPGPVVRLVQPGFHIEAQHRPEGSGRRQKCQEDGQIDFQPQGNAAHAASSGPVGRGRLCPAVCRKEKARLFKIVGM